MMCIAVDHQPPCSVVSFVPRSKVRFGTTQVRSVTHIYPADYFYTRYEMDRWERTLNYFTCSCICHIRCSYGTINNHFLLHRFRQEAYEERLRSSVSPVQRAFNIATSSVIMALFMIVGILVAMVACLPVLLAIKIASVISSFFVSRQDMIESSINPDFPETDYQTISLAERLLLVLFGQPSISCTNNV